VSSQYFRAIKMEKIIPLCTFLFYGACMAEVQNTTDTTSYEQSMNATYVAKDENTTSIEIIQNITSPDQANDMEVKEINSTNLEQTANTKLDDWLENLDITPDIVEKLASDNKTVVTATAIAVLKNKLQKNGISLSLSPKEARFSQSLPNQCQDETSCGCRAESRDIQVFAGIKTTSSFSSTNHLFEESGIFLEAKIDAEIGASGNIRVKGSIRDLKDIYERAEDKVREKAKEKLRKKRSPGFGKKFKKSFKKAWKQVVKNPIKKINRELIERPLKKLKCVRLVRKTIGFNLVSTGVVKLGINLSLGDVSFTEVEGGMLLSFIPKLDILGQVVSWNLNELEASKCVERIAGLKLISYCGYLERKARKKIEEGMKKVQEVKVPALIEKLEKKLKTKMGKAVSVLIPMEFSG